MRIELLILVLCFVVSAAFAGTNTISGEQQNKAQEVLRKAMRDMDAQSPAAPVRNPPPVRPPTFSQIEQQYLAGKITARQFQKYLQEFKMDASVPAGTVTQDQQGRAQTSATAPASTPAAVATPPPSKPNAETNPELKDLESRMDELLRLKEAREKSTNAPPSALGGPKTKREKLDELLRQLVDGKISDEEYKAQREKVLQEK